MNKSAETQPDYRVITQGVEISVGWIKKGETSGKDYVSLALAAPEFGQKKLCANLRRIADQHDKNLYVMTCCSINQFDCHTL